MIRSLAGIAAVALLAVVAIEPPRVQGTSYNPLTVDEGSVRTMTSGATVILFHSGTEQTRRSIHPGDVLTVSRARRSCRDEAVGTIRAEAPAGELCFRATVLEGEVRPHDVAHAGAVSFLVILSDDPCQHEIDH